MPPERAEDMAQLNLGVHFLRLGAWDELSSVSKMSSAILTPCPCCPSSPDRKSAFIRPTYSMENVGLKPSRSEIHTVVDLTANVSVCNKFF